MHSIKVYVLTLLLLMPLALSVKAGTAAHNPERACRIMASMGLQTNEWSYIDGFGYNCFSGYRDIDYRPFSNVSANNIAYYVSGDKNTVKEMSLTLNVNNPSNSGVAHNELLKAATLLFLNAAMDVLPEGIENAILQGSDQTAKAGGFIVNVARSDHPDGKYDIKFILQ